MLNWIRRWAFARQQNVYRFFDGQRMRKADPLRVWREIHRHSAYRAGDWKLVKDGHGKLQHDAAERISEVCRDVFGLMAVEDGGLTDADCLSLMRNFDAYGEVQKKKYRTDADLALLFGYAALGHCESPHERRFGLALNLDRCRIAAGDAVAHGIRIALGGHTETTLTALTENERERELTLSRQEANRKRGQKHGN